MADRIVLNTISYHGHGAIENIVPELTARGYKKAFVCSDPDLIKFGVTTKVTDLLDAAGFAYSVYSDIKPNPTIANVQDGVAAFKAAEADCIVTIGGGSSMDTAKGVNVLINNPPPLMQYFGVQKNLRPGLPMVFVPTTAGTGSETTNMCVISCVSQGKKDSIVSPVCVGSLAILDPELTMGLPPKATAMTGIDAFAHAVESLTGGQANPLSDALARDAIRTITRWLPRAVENGKDEAAREKMLEASFFAGMAFTNALVHLGHSIGHSIGAKFHVPHGLACSFCLPEVIEYTARTEREKVEMICEAMGVSVPEGASWQEVGALAKDAIRALIKRVGLGNIQDSGIPLDDLLKIAPMVTADTGFAILPYRIPASRVAEMFRSAYSA